MVNGTLRTIPRLVPGSDEWLTQPYVSASVCAALFGQHDFTTVGDIAAVRRGGPAPAVGEPAEMGNDLEPFILDRFENEHNLALERPTVTYVNGPLSANPDGMVPGSKTIVQAKFTTKTEGHFPRYWFWQGQCEMACTGADLDIFAVLYGGSGCYRELPVARDDDAIERLTVAAESFLAALDLGIEPAPVTLDPREQRVTLGLEEARLAEKFVTARTIRLEAEKTETAAKGKLLALLGLSALSPGSKVVALYDGQPLLKARVQNGRSSVDWSRLPAGLKEQATVPGTPTIVIEGAA